MQYVNKVRVWPENTNVNFDSETKETYIGYTAVKYDDRHRVWYAVTPDDVLSLRVETTSDNKRIWN